MELTLLWAAITAVALGWLGLRLWSKRLPPQPFDRFIAATITGLAVGRLTAMMSQGVNPLANPADIIIVRGGVHTGGAAVAFVASLLWSTRHDRGALDALAPATLLGLSGWHAGCLWRGSCLGSASDLPWAWAQAGSAVTRHPVELYAAIALALGALLVSRLPWRDWLRSGSALGLAAAVRLVTEPLRPSLTGGPISWYWAAMAVSLGVVAWSYRPAAKSIAPT